jgi:hypothetical protein
MGIVAIEVEMDFQVVDTFAKQRQRHDTRSPEMKVIMP